MQQYLKKCVLLVVFASSLIFISLSSSKDQRAEKPPGNKWIQTSPMTEPRNGATAVISGDYGGYKGNLLKTVERAILPSF